MPKLDECVYQDILYKLLDFVIALKVLYGFCVHFSTVFPKLNIMR
jgi:hypothetical protein